MFHETVLNLSFRSGLSEATAIDAQDSTTRSLLAAFRPSSGKSDNRLQALRNLEEEVEVESAAQEAALAKHVRPRSAGSRGVGDSSDDGEFLKEIESRSA